MVVVIDGTVTHNGASYIAGEVITGMAETDEQRLVSLKVCQKVEQTEPEREPVLAGEATVTNVVGIDLSVDPNDFIKAPSKGGKRK